MRTVQHFTLSNKQVQTIGIPKGAKLLKVEILCGRFVIWALINTKAPKEERWFEIYRPGQPILKEDRLTHLESSEYLGHLFERI